MVRIVLTSCESKQAVFPRYGNGWDKGKCPYCGGYTIIHHYLCEGYEYADETTTVRCAYCPRCDILFLYDTRRAWENELSKICP